LRQNYSSPAKEASCLLTLANGNLANDLKAGRHFIQMQFDYEIPVDEYAAAQMLYYRGHSKGKFFTRALGRVLLGLFFVLIAVFRSVVDWGPILLLLTGTWFICGGIASLFPTRYFRRAYPESGLAGKKYHAELDENGFSVTGDSCSWRVLWTEVLLKGENNRVFMFNAKATIFIFGKQYLTDDQQKDIRQFAAMP
jgi:hypothetical protein